MNVNCFSLFTVSLLLTVESESLFLSKLLANMVVTWSSGTATTSTPAS
jgi:hypothetical protein